MAELGDQPPRQETSAVARRAVLRAAGLIGLTGAGAAALSACADASGGSPPLLRLRQTSAKTTPSPTADTTSPKPSASTAAAPKGPSVATSKVPVGGGVILEDADYVVTQPSKGKYKAFSKICTHQGCPVASVNDGVIHCDCHGSEYSIEDGSVTTRQRPNLLPRPRQPSSRTRSTLKPEFGLSARAAVQLATVVSSAG